MTNPKTRRLFILAHLWFAGLLAPAFLLVAVSGGLYLIGNKGEFKSTPVTLPASASLNFQSPSLEQDVRDLLASADIDHKFEYIRNRGTVIQLRPTSRTYLEFRQSDAGLTATRKVPDLQGKLIELHKGHGPQAFKTYQKFVAIGLLGVVFGGILVGLLAKAYRRQTLIAVVIGTVIFYILAFLV
jgi:hypothetical protein